MEHLPVTCTNSNPLHFSTGKCTPLCDPWLGFNKAILNSKIYFTFIPLLPLYSNWKLAIKYELDSLIKIKMWKFVFHLVNAKICRFSNTKLNLKVLLKEITIVLWAMVLGSSLALIVVLLPVWWSNKPQFRQFIALQFLSFGVFIS